MQNPAKEIENAALTLTAAMNPAIQKEAVLKYYASDAAFKHPLCEVPSAPNSREGILKILQWYRVMSPHLSVHVNSVTYDEHNSAIFMDITQTFHIRWSIFSPAPARLITKLTLKPTSPATSPPTYQIAVHEDWYHPTDFLALVVPPLIPFARIALRLGAIGSAMGARAFGILGYWSASSGTVQIDPRGEPLPPPGAEEGEELRDMSGGASKKKKKRVPPINGTGNGPNEAGGPDSYAEAAKVDKKND